MFPCLIKMVTPSKLLLHQAKKGSINVKSFILFQQERKTLLHNNETQFPPYLCYKKNQTNKKWKIIEKKLNK